MENKIFCQSCTMPLDTEEIKGTEKDNSKNKEYCKYCYENGAFKDPNMTLLEMEVIVKTQMKKTKLPDNLIKTSLNLLPNLKRWNTKALVK